MARQKANPTRIQKSGNGHSYYLDGEWCPGVTTVLSNGIPKNGLIEWASGIPSDYVANMLQVAKDSQGRTRVVADEMVEDLRQWQEARTGGKKVPWSTATPLPRGAVADALKSLKNRDRDTAANRGTEVHGLAERLAHGEEVQVPDELAGHVASYVRFLDSWNPYDAITERVVINRRWRYMGKFDLLARFDNLPTWIAERIGSTSGVGLLDVKTSRSGIFAEVALQLEAYRRAETMLTADGRDEIPMPAVDFVAAIHVRADGFDVYAFDIETASRPSTFDVFLYAKQVGDWLDWKEGPASRIKSPSLRPSAPTADHEPEGRDDLATATERTATDGQ